MDPRVPHAGGGAPPGTRAVPVPGRAGPGRTIQSVDRAIDVLEVLARTGEELPLGEIARQTGLNVSTCHHLLATLVNRGYVGRSRLGRLYFIGARASELSRGRPNQANLVEAALPELRRLSGELGETVHWSALVEHEVWTLARVEPGRGDGGLPGHEPAAAHATAGGKALLAWLPEAEVARILDEQGLQRLTESTTTDARALKEELGRIRRDGFASDCQESQAGVNGLGAAVRDFNGAVIAAVSCSVPAAQAPEDRMEELRAAVCECANRLSEQLGSLE